MNATSPVTGMAEALVHEIATHLDALARTGIETTLDLRSLPLTPADLDALKDRLGTGEVTATVAGQGRSDVHETASPGLWWITHFDVHGTFLMHELAIAAVPPILKADPDDIAQGIARLTAAPAPKTQEDLS